MRDATLMLSALAEPPLADRLAAVREVAAGPVWLVGGTVRDLIAGRTPPDLDLALEGDALAAGHALAHVLGGAFVPLDEGRGTARVVADGITIDLTTTGGLPIAEDLARRDFTANAMAVPLGETPALIDPFGGAGDLAAGVLRAVSEAALADDPARVLRAFRFAATLGLAIEPDTLAMLRRQAAGLVRVPGERVTHELALMLAVPHAAPVVTLASDAGALGVVLPELEAERGVTQNAYHHLDVLGHSLEALTRLEAILASLPDLVGGTSAERLSAFLQQEPVAERPRTFLLKLGVLLHDSGKPACRGEKDGRVIFYGHPSAGEALTRDAAARLRLSMRETEELARYVARHMQPVDLLAHPMTPRRAARFFRKEGECGLALLLLALADAEATRGPAANPASIDRLRAFVRMMADDYYAWAEPRLAAKPLLSGTELMAAFGLTPGPGVGALLALMRDAQDAGEIATRDEALALVRRELALVSARDPQGPDDGRRTRDADQADAP